MKRTSVCVNRMVERRCRPVVLWDCVDGSLVEPEGKTDIPHYDFRESVVPGELRILDWEYGVGDAGWAKDTESGLRLLPMVYSKDFVPFWKTADNYSLLSSILKSGFRPSMTPDPEKPFAAVINPKTNRAMILEPGSFVVKNDVVKCTAESYPMAHVRSDDMILTDETPEMKVFCVDSCLDKESDFVMEEGKTRISITSDGEKVDVEGMEAEIRNLRLQLLESSEKYEKEVSERMRLEAVLKASSEDNIRHAQENDRLRNAVTELQKKSEEDLAASASSAEDLRRRCEEAESDLQRLRTECSDLRESLDKALASYRNGPPTGISIRRVSENELESRFFRPGAYSVRIAVDGNFLIVRPDAEGIPCEGGVLRMKSLNEKVPYSGTKVYSTYSVPNGGLKMLLRRSLQRLGETAVHQVVQDLHEPRLRPVGDEAGVLPDVLLEEGGRMPFLGVYLEVPPVRRREHALDVVELAVYVGQPYDLDVAVLGVLVKGVAGGVAVHEDHRVLGYSPDPLYYGLLVLHAVER